jgi:hypothetical protein
VDSSRLEACRSIKTETVVLSQRDLLITRRHRSKVLHPGESLGRELREIRPMSTPSSLRLKIEDLRFALPVHRLIDAAGEHVTVLWGI